MTIRPDSGPALAVLLGLIVLLAVFHEAPSTARRSSLPIFLQPRIARHLAWPRFELFDEAFVGLRTMFALSTNGSALSFSLRAVSHVVCLG